ncbi:aminotransferase class V-fold PLP-dependent enzyme [Krasilnikovia sp. MM14-A1259]|uniref:aminotransferase class V-fold PLP-dependent enzyme n=1 Tax=Krasilnikovia sp. MM14-A1259 TaxID=3373539 RepID=UPI00380C2251
MYPTSVHPLLPQPTDLDPPAPTPAHPLAVLGGDVRVRVTDGRLLPYANLDVAATAPCAAVAAEAVARLLPTYASVHRGAGALSRHCTRAYEQARATVARYVGCRAGDQVVFTRNSTDALNLLAHAVPRGADVLTFVGEHHANLLPWRRAIRLPLPGTPDDAVAAVDRALRRHGPALVAVTATSNVTGEVWPVAEIARVARRYGARVVVDAAQLAAHGPVSLAALGADYVVLSGHKLYAPFGAGVLAGRADWLDDAEPYLRGGGATRHVDADATVQWTGGPARHEAGTPNLVGAVALAAVCAALTETCWAGLARHEQRLLDRLDAGLAGVAGVQRLALFGPGHPRTGIVSFVVAGLESAEVARRLADDHGIGVRDGLFCAHPLTRHLLAAVPAAATPAAPPTTAVRVSIGAGTTVEHVDRLVAALAQIAARPGGRCTQSFGAR